MGDNQDTTSVGGGGGGGGTSSGVSSEGTEIIVGVNSESSQMSGDDASGVTSDLNISSSTANLHTAEHRLQQLERAFLEGPLGSNGQSYSTETLIDVLLVLYDECTNSSLRREKTVSDFIEFGRFIYRLV